MEKQNNFGSGETAVAEVDKKNNKKKSTGKWKKIVDPLIFIGPHLLFFLVFFIIPFFFGIFISFTKWDLMSDIEFVGFQNFAQIWDIKGWINSTNVFADKFFSGLKYTLYYTVVMVPLIVIVPLIFALAIHKLSHGKKFVQAVLYIPSLLSVATVALTWRWLLDLDNGVINNFFFKDNPINFVKDYAWQSIFALTLWSGVGGNLIIFMAGLSGIPQSYYEAADIDGANGWVKFWKITLPEMSFQLLFTTVMGTIGAFNVFGQPYMFGTPTGQKVLMQYIQEYAFGSSVSMAGMASAMSVSLGLIISVFSVIQFRLMRVKD